MRHALRLAALLIALLGMTACGNQPQDYTKEILGTWQLTKAYYDNGYSVKDLTPDYAEGYALQFLADGTVFIFDNEVLDAEPWQQTYEISGNAITIHYQPIEDIDTYLIVSCKGKTMVLNKTTFADTMIITEEYKKIKQ